ncbi:MAG TPA: hypothetical protein VFA34_16330 [Actinomycetota bacterium]|jgi:hypothetical protein|nr:hypothetical protein [Actinomycetota bacterium]
MTGRAFFESVGDALVNFLPPSLRNFDSYHTSQNFKLWFGEPRQEHYEVQYISRRSVLEIGFHAEYRERSRNDEVIERFMVKERAWRKALGRTVEVGPFIGAQSGSWRRISELWENIGDPDAAIEAAERLASYVRTFEPIRTA